MELANSEISNENNLVLFELLKFLSQRLGKRFQIQ